MPANAAIEIQFNRILDAQQLQASKDDLFTVTLDGAKLAGTISSQVNNSGTKLIYVPAQNFVDGRRYRVTVSGALRDLHGKSLGSDYGFRFIAANDNQPKIARIQPEFASWRGGDTLALYGENFTPTTQVFLAGKVVPASEITFVNATELRLRAPPLNKSPADNYLVGLQVRNGLLGDSRHGFLPI